MAEIDRFLDTKIIIVEVLGGSRLLNGCKFFQCMINHDVEW